MKITKNTLSAGLLSASKIIFGFLLHKFVALFFGPSGTLTLAHFQNFLAIVTQPVQDIFNQAFVNRAAAVGKTDGGLKKLSPYLTLSFLVAGTLILVFLAFQQTGIEIFAFNKKELALLAVGLLAFVPSILLSSVYVLRKEITRLLVILIAAYFLLFLLLYIVSLTIGQFLVVYLSFLTLQTAFLLVDLFSRRLLNTDDLLPKLNFKEADKKAIVSFLIIGLSVWLSSKLIDYYVRLYALDHYGASLSGEWQAIIRISDSMKGLIASFFMITLFPKLSSMINPKAQISTLKHLYSIYIPLLLSTLAVYYFGREVILTTLYSSAYNSLYKEIIWVVLGDFFALLAFPLGILLMARQHKYHFALLELISAITFILAIYMFRQDDIQSLFYAYPVRFILYFSILILSIRFRK